MEKKIPKFLKIDLSKLLLYIFIKFEDCDLEV